MKKKAEGIQFGKLLVNLAIVASVVVALTSGWQWG
jgi:hypothetical protein